MKSNFSTFQEYFMVKFQSIYPGSLPLLDQMLPLAQETAHTDAALIVGGDSNLEPAPKFHVSCTTIGDMRATCLQPNKPIALTHAGQFLNRDPEILPERNPSISVLFLRYCASIMEASLTCNTAAFVTLIVLSCWSTLFHTNIKSAVLLRYGLKGTTKMPPNPCSYILDRTTSLNDGATFMPWTFLVKGTKVHSINVRKLQRQLVKMPWMNRGVHLLLKAGGTVFKSGVRSRIGVSWTCQAELLLNGLA